MALFKEFLRTYRGENIMIVSIGRGVMLVVALLSVWLTPECCAYGVLSFFSKIMYLTRLPLAVDYALLSS
ncbi:hypothetical protein BV22DRAFT_1032178 [Leucogyrophana mollusca]|uniref:Uncharacterized protein n=1 Tax=Leucogyrophana mollusca TaxID=85980 RepID=A0ACB8BPN8_9AGAM|nr:hypothetical protein BV22DRAFT_1032178 [Leucogyrophana mollusca]